MGTLVLAGGVEAAEGLAVLKVKGKINVGGLPGQVEHAHGLVADELALDGVAHVTIGDKPSVFSNI